MNPLLLIDWFAVRRYLPWYGLYALAFIVGVGLMEGGPGLSFASLFSTLGVCLMALYQSFKAEEKGGGSFAASLPSRPASRLHAKLALLALAGASAYAGASLIGAIASLPPLSLDIGRVTALDGLRAASCVLALTAILPVWFRFGAQGVRAFNFIGIAIGVLLQVGLVAAIGRGRKPAMLALLDRAKDVGRLSLELWIFAGAALVAAASYLASRAILARREW